MDIDKSWLPTLLCVVRDAIRYNDGLRHSQTVKDVEDIEEWILQIYQLKEHLADKLKNDPETLKKCEPYLKE